MRSLSRATSPPALDLPPPFSLVTLREVGDAFEHAKAVAAETGAGTLVHVGRFDLSEFAVVLEPEEPLAARAGAFYACMVALRDALLVACSSGAADNLRLARCRSCRWRLDRRRPHGLAIECS